MVVPGERWTEGVVDYLVSGVSDGMNVPDATDRNLEQFRVVG